MPVYPFKCVEKATKNLFHSLLHFAGTGTKKTRLKLAWGYMLTFLQCNLSKQTFISMNFPKYADK